MIVLESVLRTAINPALALLPLKMDTAEARVMLIAIGLQESEFMHRHQVLSGGRKGPARGFWQFEEGGGVKGVMTHPMTCEYARTVCAARECPWDRRMIWMRLEMDDQLAAAFARLLLLSDPAPLPSAEYVNHEEAWQYYFRNWRPGKPHRDKWDGYHNQALSQVIH